mmetsp:Transcript_8701/g.32787  ORF Transcript_8701/g.32787 Transcript_8701/m.32787 type:complete len:431 (-) Transcript_8701:882-2174(-)
MPRSAPRGRRLRGAASSRDGQVRAPTSLVASWQHEPSSASLLVAVADHIFLRSALIRKDLLPLYVGRHMPATFLLRSEDDARRLALFATSWDAAEQRESSCEDVDDLWQNHDGLQYHNLPPGSPKWVVKPSNSSNAHGLRFCWAPSDIPREFRMAKQQDSDRDSPWLLQRVVPCCPLHLATPEQEGPPAHKFHIRTLVLLLGDLDVFVYEASRVLVAPEPMAAGSNQHAHVTNCSYNREHPLYDERRHNVALAQVDVGESAICTVDSQDTAGNEAGLDLIQSQIRRIAADIGAALVNAEFAARKLRAAGQKKKRHFFTLPNMYEVFGLDFMVDHSKRVVLLEVNPAPSRSLFPESCQGGFLAGRNPVVDGVPSSYRKVYSKRLSLMIAKMKAAAAQSRRASDAEAENASENADEAEAHEAPSTEAKEAGT